MTAVIGASLYRVSSSRLISAPAEELFDFIAQPANHPMIDGSSSVVSILEGPDRLYLNARFRMAMHLLIPYKIWNTVVIFDEGRSIGWRHAGRHIWRYDLQDNAEGTLVTETFDWGDVISKFGYELFRIPSRNAISIEASLNRLADIFGD